MQMNNQDNLMNVIKGGFEAFYSVAHAKTKSRFKNMPTNHKYMAARALVVLRDVAARPEKYFSRAATEMDWRARGLACAKTRGIDPQWAAHYIVQTPASILMEKVDAAFIEETRLRNRMANFCDEVLDWFYNSTSQTPGLQMAAKRNAEKIRQMNQQICKERDILENGKLMYSLMNSKFGKMVLPQRQK